MDFLEFTKGQGLGNDFILIEDLDCCRDLSSGMIKSLCNRRYGIGADGLILVRSSDKADFQMKYYNSDGSPAKMCGNGIRVTAKYIYDRILAKECLLIETGDGLKEVELENDGDRTNVTVNMGRPSLEADEIPVVSDTPRFINKMLPIGPGDYFATAVSMGNPHCVIFVDDTSAAPVDGIGSAVEYLEIFPDRVNVEFAQVLEENKIRLRVWERGVGETTACGTGACATVVAAAVNGLSGRRVDVELPGGTLDIDWRDDDSVMMTGPAAEVFEGRLDLERWMKQGEMN